MTTHPCRRAALVVGLSLVVVMSCAARRNPPAPQPSAKTGTSRDGEPSAALRALKAQMRDVLTVPGVAFVYADPSCNCLVVGITRKESTSLVNEHARKVGVPPEKIKTVMTAPIRPFASLRDGIRPVLGGLQITNNVGSPWSHEICTQTATVLDLDRGASGLLTCSHCTAVSGKGYDGTVFYQGGWDLFGNNYVATKLVDPPFTTQASDPSCPAGRMCRHSDAAYAEFPNASIGALGVLARPAQTCGGAGQPAPPCSVAMNAPTDALTIVGVGWTLRSIVGMGVYKIGQTSGWTGGAITAACVDVNVDGTSITLLCQNFASGYADHGDSGSPVFELLLDDQVQLVGILWGGPTDNSSFVFSSISDVVAELGHLSFFTPCAAGTTRCGGACVNTSTDPSNCGSCGNACGRGFACSGGACICGGTLCGGACVNTSTDPNNCGGCGKACGEGFACGAGRCICGGTVCDSVCVDTKRDPNNCGGCGTTCPSGFCRNSKCIPCPKGGCP